jgi:hypothetical protein
MVFSSLYGSFPENISTALEQLMRHGNANPNVQIILKTVQRPGRAQGETFDAFLRKVDAENGLP